MQRRRQCGALLFLVAGHTQRAAHKIRCDDQARHTHGRKSLLERGHSDHNRGDPGGFEQTCNMSHGHVTNRSDRHQQNRVNCLRLKQSHPFGASALEQRSLCTGADKGIRLWRQFPDLTLRRQLA